MSGQSNPSTPRTKTSPKQGPLRATMPISSVTKEGSSLRRSTSPGASPQNGLTGDSSLGRRSPGAAPYKGAPVEPHRESNAMRRTASLDTIYLRGLFPREGVLWHTDRATQTDPISASLDSLQASDLIEDKLARLNLRQRRRSCSRESNDHAHSSSQTRNCASPSSRSPASAVPKSSRSSEEGLNQEIESYNLRSETECDRLKQPTPEGRKAPVADLLRDVPNFRSFPHSGNQNSSEDSVGSSPDQDHERPVSGSSPQINRFSSRAPPDGCERVVSKSVPLIRPIPLEVKSSHPHVLFTLKPSSHSAFETLQKGLDTLEPNEETDKETPIVPDQ